MWSGKINCFETVCLKPSIKSVLFTASDVTCVMQLSLPFTHTFTLAVTFTGRERVICRGEVLFGLKPYSLEVSLFT